MQAIQSHLQKVKYDVDEWVTCSSSVSGSTLVSLQKVFHGLITNPAEMPMIDLPKPTSTSSIPSSSSSSSTSETPSLVVSQTDSTPSSSSAPAPPPPPPPPSLAGGPAPPPPPKAPRALSVKFDSSPVENKRGSTGFAPSFLDSIRSGTSLKKLDPKEVQREKEKQARESTATGLAATLQETMRIAMELRKKAMEAQDSDDEDEDDEDDEDDDDEWYDDDE
jgi:hypothetical protein